MLKRFENLGEYVWNKMGGFTIDGWNIRTAIEGDL